MTNQKFDLQVSPAAPASADIDAWIDGRTISVEFYMPIEPVQSVTGQTADDGDRLNVGDKVMLLGTGTTATSLGSDILVEECNINGVVLTMGANTLAFVSTFAVAANLFL